MKEITCVIIDDEPLASDLLERYVHKTRFLKWAYTSNDAKQGLEWIKNNIVDLVFLDIQMPDLNGMELSRMLPEHVKVIFTSAFDHYAIESYKVGAMDYLLKPFNYEEFITAALKVVDWFSMQEQVETIEKEDYFFVRSEYKHVKILHNDIVCVEGMKDYVKIWLKSQDKPIVTILSLKSLEEKLPHTMFMRVHRSYIVALGMIHTIERGQIVINDKIRITIADKYKVDFQEFLNNKMI